MEILHTLRRHDFPDCAHAALRHLLACVEGDDNSIPGVGMSNDELAEKIVDEFVFARPALRKSGHQKNLTFIEELLVQQILVEFFEHGATSANADELRAAIFSRLFPPNMQMRRLDFLSRFVSMAISVRGRKVLDAVAVWMQVHQCSSAAVSQMALSLVEDHCGLVSSGVESLRGLPDLSPRFTCNLLTALTAASPHTGSASRVSPTLLDLIADWLTADPWLCLSSLTPPPAPARTDVHPARTPLPGLARWCTSSPPGGATCRWWRVHAALLRSLAAFATLPGASRSPLVSLDDMRRVVTATPDGGDDDENAPRLAQFLQVALATGAFRCSLGDLRSICELIPDNRLLRILEKQHLSSTPPKMHNVTTAWSEVAK